MIHWRCSFRHVRSAVAIHVAYEHEWRDIFRLVNMRCSRAGHFDNDFIYFVFSLRFYPLSLPWLEFLARLFYFPFWILFALSIYYGVNFAITARSRCVRAHGTVCAPVSLLIISYLCARQRFVEQAGTATKLEINFRSHTKLIAQ